MPVKKGWTYIKGHYKKNGTWGLSHRSLRRELFPSICVLAFVIGSFIYLLLQFLLQ